MPFSYANLDRCVSQRLGLLVSGQWNEALVMDQAGGRHLETGASIHSFLYHLTTKRKK